MKKSLLISILCFLLILCGCTHKEAEVKTSEYAEIITQTVDEEADEVVTQGVNEEADAGEIKEQNVAEKNASVEEPESLAETVQTPETEDIVEITPAEIPGEVTDEEGLFCTLEVKCDSILQNTEKLKEGKLQFVPENGIIFPSKKIKFEEGETVFDVLKRELIGNKIHLEFSVNPMYKSAYIEGIANIYEFDCGDMSGWLYTVNGKSPNVGCSQYVVEEGDSILFYYNCR